MTTDPVGNEPSASRDRPAEPPAGKPEPAEPKPTAPKQPEPRPAGPAEPKPGRTPAEPRVTRAGAAWTAVVAGLIVFILLVVFFIQNQDVVQVHFLGMVGPVPLGLALFIAAVAGGVLVAIAGAVRIFQLRIAARRARRTPQRPR